MTKRVDALCHGERFRLFGEHKCIDVHNLPASEGGPDIVELVTNKARLDVPRVMEVELI